MSAFEAHMMHYRAEHRTVGCKVSHMIGIPLIAASSVILVFHWPAALAMFVVGWAFQLAGHRYFEHNRPVLAADPKNPMTYIAAVIFVAQEWGRVLTGRGLRDDAPVNDVHRPDRRSAA